MATIRIYKVAEVLGLKSQEVTELLKRNHGINAKSASSTIEEIVARQFAERIAKERKIELPQGALFTTSSIRRSTTKQGKAPKQTKPEAAKSSKPKLGPPRLVKTVKAEPAAAQY